jgi:hypothetical protein
MRETLVYPLFLFAFLLLSPSAWASWRFVSTGTTTGVGNPSCAQAAKNLVACAVRSSTYSLMVNQFNGTTWSKWTSLAGVVTSAPTCTGDGDGKVFCTATTSGGMTVSIFNGASWSKPANVAGTLYSAPSCAEYLAGEILCVARGASGGLVWSLYDGTSWSKFATLATTALSAPSCTTDNNSGVICAVFTTGYATLVNRFAAGKWEAFLDLGGVAAGDPDCTSLDSGGQVVCYAEAWDSQIYGTRFLGGAWTNTNWTAYASIGGVVNTNASCTVQSAGEQICGAYGVGSDDDVFYADIYNGSGWEGWTKIGSAGFGIPSCAPLGTGQVVCAIMQSKNQLTSAVGP